MKVELNQRTCEGTGFCVQVAPELFALDGARARLLTEDVPDGVKGPAEEAETLCPTQSIRLRNESGA